MFATNIAEKSSGELGTAWQRYRNADHQGWVLPWELSWEQNKEGKEKLFAQAHTTTPTVQKGDPANPRSVP